MIGRNFTNEEKQSVERLIPYAKRKTFVAELLVNGYNSRISSTDVATLVRYDLGEPANSTYCEDIITYLRIISRGIETHEIIGQHIMDEILEIIPRYFCNDCRGKFSNEDMDVDTDGNCHCPKCGAVLG